MTTDDDATIDTAEPATSGAGPSNPGYVTVEHDLVGIETVVHDDDVGTYEARYDWHADPPGLAVVSVLAAIEDRDPTDVTPLQETVDLDALNSLLASGHDGGHDASVTFTVERYRVTVSTTHVRVRPIGRRDRSLRR